MNKLNAYFWSHKYIKDIPNLSDFYFVNSFVFSPLNQEDLISSTNYGIDFCSIISNKNIFGTQFHPEKSSKIGLKILENFLNA